MKTSARRLCLLVVDDEPEVCDSVYHLLRRDYQVLRANGAVAAVEMMAQHEVDLILSDQRMPDITGVEMLRKIKAEYPEAIRMLFTGYTDIDSVIDAINRGHIYRYLSKPWQPEELIAAVADAAAEFHRIVERTRVLAEDRRKTEELATDLANARARLADLENENERLRAQLPDEG